MTARARLAEAITEQFGFTADEADRIIEVYLDCKILRFDGVSGSTLLSHGAYWEAAPMREALKLPSPSERSDTK